jgi:Flp pilus assembly pilin Flp
MKEMAIKLVTAVQSRQRLDDEGAVSAEYGVLLAGVVAVVAVAAAALGGRISDIFDAVLP